MYNVILVPVDGSTFAERAWPQALRIAHLSGARIVLLQVIPPSGDGVDSSGGVAELSQAADAYLKELCDHTSAGVDVETVIAVGEPALTIIQEANQRDVDLVVMSTHGRFGLGRWIYGSVADAVMRHAPVPVILVPATGQLVRVVDHPPRILVPLDGSSLAEEVLGAVGNLAEAMGADLILTRVVEPHSPAYTDMDYVVTIDPTMEVKAAQDYLESVAARLRTAGRSVQVQGDYGVAETTITDMAERLEAAIIAMATHGRGGITRLLLGSVATSVVQRSTVPVFLVRPATRQQVNLESAATTLEEAAVASGSVPGPETISAAAQGDFSAGEVVLRALATSDVGSYLRTRAKLRQEADPNLWEYLVEYLSTRQWSGHPVRIPGSGSDRRELDRRIRDAFLPDLGAAAEGAKLRALRTSIRKPEVRIQKTALDLIGLRRDLGATEEVIGALTSNSLVVKEAGAEALGQLGGVTAVAPLIGALHAEHDVLGRVVAHALVCVGTEAVPALIDALNDPDVFVRRHAAEALAEIGDLRAIDPLLRAVEDADVTVRWKAARGLARLGRPAVLALLRALETRPLTPWLAQGAERVLHGAPLGDESFRLQPIADALYHSTASLEVPLRAAEVLREIEALSESPSRFEFALE